MHAGASQWLGVNIAPRFDQRSLALYVLLAFSGLLELIALGISGVDVSAFFGVAEAIGLTALILVAAMLRRLGWVRSSTGLETCVLVAVALAILFPLQFAMATVPAPWADEALFAVDRALGFDWLAFASALRGETATRLLRIAYLSMWPQAYAILLLLAATGAITRAWRFLTALFLIFLIAVIFIAIAPAQGRFVLCGLHPADIPVFLNFCDYPAVLAALHDRSLRLIDADHMIGMVSFPSGHSAAGALFVWAVWPYRPLRLPALLLNIALCAGAIVVGSHYLADVLAGFALAAASLWVSRSMVPDPCVPSPLCEPAKAPAATAQSDSMSI
ncbi:MULTISPECIES: phosphatase PAP2 family protein [Sphingomonas]|uniref:phosphatase PAP2 family protein n=1 Tax=Sphingomonas TaxID=13687 RepID=UPI000DEF04D1|nr:MULTISPECIES: phosphatase PAP2 family protein [Sphingomonas]